MKLIIKTAIFILFPLFLSYPQELNGPTPWEVIGNLYSQPNIHMQVGRKALDWYGSGDVNNDEKIDNSDTNSILGSSSDRADVDGDGNPGTFQDKSLLVDYLNGGINYLPGHWNELQTKAERVSWIEKMLKVQDMTPYISGGQGEDFVCASYINQMQIDFHGISNINEFIQNNVNNGGVEYNPTHNARFNLPFYHTSTLNINGIPHSAGSFFIGDGNSSSTDVLNFEDYYSVNYYEDDELVPGEFDLNENGYYNVGLTAYVEDPFIPGEKYFTGVSNIVKFNLENGEATLTDYKANILVRDNPNDDEVYVQPHDDLYVDAGGFDSDYVFNVNSLYQLGYTEVIPEVTTENTPLSPEIDYYYPPDTVYTGGENYSFKIKVVAKLESGGVINADSTEYWIHIDFTTDVEGENRPTKFKLYQNYPNPFNPSTTIEYSIPTVGSAYNAFRNVRLDVFNSLGKRVATIVNEQKPPGNYSVTFDASELPSGVYFYKLQSGKFSEVKKMMLLK